MINRWLIAFACGWVNLFIFSVFRSSGLVYVKILELFDCSYQQAAYSVSLVGSVASTTGIASGFLTHYFTPRSLIMIGILICSASISLTYWANSIHFVIISVGILQGIGIGFVTCLLPAVLNSHFNRQKSIALGISYAGATLGAFIFPLVIQWMFSTYGFHVTMLILGGVILNAIIGAIWLKIKDNNFEYEQEEHQSPVHQIPMEITRITSAEGSIDCNNEEKSVEFWQQFKHNLIKDYRLLSNFRFFLCSFTYINFIIDFIAFIIILPDVAKDRQILPADAKWLLSIFAITDFAGRLIPGWLSFWKLTSDKCTYIMSILILGLCMLLLVNIESWTNFVLVTLLCGFVTGCQMVLSPVVLADYFGTENTAIAFGMENFICGLLSMFLRPMIIGIKDIHGTYYYLGYILFISTIINIALWIFEIVFRQKTLIVQ
ncbi:hypothetical protein DERP_000211 [Dermatophagoides pteronyssinus]|uniref:Major facilitator superfamily (MFS) profile domain-containing protein n=1 Tax=Dermatophagoides pteronyssinus TaxID=6956 RepID=A0ABQ8IZM7_DERPT|nr:hypothetical protein DERP_000211 [Dermatophagoides pteronyssinus]